MSGGPGTGGRADAVRLTTEEAAVLAGADGPAAATAMRIVTEAARLLGADSLVPIGSAHIDGCLYHGDGGVEFAERLVREEGAVKVPTTLNVGALDLLHPGRVKGDDHRLEMSRRLMNAYLSMGCSATWTCAPYQAGHRPAVGEQVAWGESNAVAFANSVLGARTNRYGDFLDIACALVGRAPFVGLHLDAARRATVVVDTSELSERLRDLDAFYPVLGSWLGRAVGDRVAVVDGLPPTTSEDRLKALGAAAASTGAVALFHVSGVTPEAPTVEAALGGQPPERVIRVTPEDVRATLATLSTSADGAIDAVALGSPHFSRDEFCRLHGLARGRRFSVPFYVCTGRDVLREVAAEGWITDLEAAGVTTVADTCVIVAPILPGHRGTLMTNSGKFAHYTPGTTGYGVIYGSLEECVESGAAGRVVRLTETWT